MPQEQSLASMVPQLTHPRGSLILDFPDKCLIPGISLLADAQPEVQQ